MYKNNEKHNDINAFDEINAINENLTKDINYLYNGTLDLDEDPADYLRAIKGVRLA